MTPIQSLARSVTLATAAACALAVGVTASSPAAVAKKKPAQQSAEQAGKGSPEEQKSEAARKAYDAGLKEFANGRNQGAVEQLSAALKSGGLASQQTAKALYTRGLAYKKLKQPGFAISDLTSALWLKNGLTEADRASATSERAEAYGMAGIQDTGKGPERVVGTASAPSAGVTATPTAGPNAGSAGLSAAAIAQAASSNSNATSGTVTRQDSESQAAKDAANARAAYAPVNTSLQSVASSTVVSGGAAPAPAATAPTTSSSGSSGVSGFFSNLFGGGTSTPPPAQEPVTTASTTPDADVSAWSDATVVNKGGKATRTATAPVSRATPKGKYKVHIAALRSRAEADALAQQIAAQHGAELANHVPTVDEAVIGSMGTFYRVRIVGYANQEEPRGVCDKLRTSGLDCLVVTN